MGWVFFRIPGIRHDRKIPQALMGRALKSIAQE